MLNSKAIRCSTPSATCSTCSTWTLCSWLRLYPEWAAKKVDSWQLETPSRVGKSRCYSCFLMFFSCIGEWLHDARCFHPVLPSNKEIAHVCSGYASSFPASKADLPWLTDSSLYGGERLKGQNQLLKLWVYHPQCHWEEMVSMLVWIARALQPIAARGFTHWRLSRYIDGFLGRVKCSPGPISKPIDFALQNPSRAHGFIGKEKHRLHALIVPKRKPMKSRIKGRCHRSSLKLRDYNSLPYLCLIPKLSKSMVQPHSCCRLTWAEINGIA